MAIRDDVLTLKNKENTLTNNKVCNFAYDDTAFADDTISGANGVSVYNYNNHNNIPVKDLSVIKVNSTITSKGFRSQVSTLPRMLLNHIFGRISYNLNKTVDTFNALLSNLYDYIGQPNGLATLDNTGRLPYSQLPLSAVEYKGTWNASTNTPTLVSGTGTFGDEYIVSTPGTQNIGEGSIAYAVGDRVIYNGFIWQRIPSSSVRTVNTKTPDANGNVTVNANDIVTPDVYGYDKTNVGKVWSRGTFVQPKFRDSSFHYITHNKDLWIACGVSDTSDSVSGIYWSTNGQEWTEGVITGSITSSDFYYAEYDESNALWIACGSLGLWKSTDGKNWTHIDSQEIANLDIYEVKCVNGFWVAVGLYHNSAYPSVWWSTDGTNWTLGTVNLVPISFGSYSPFTCIRYVNGLWVMGGTNIYWSNDGKNWEEGTVNGGYVNLPYCNGEQSICFAKGIWLATGNTGLYWSTDGKDWTKIEGFQNPPVCVFFAEDIFVAGGSAQGIYWSNDGINWSFALHTEDVFISHIYFAEGLWIGCGTASAPYTSSLGIICSTDGKNWVDVTNTSQSRDLYPFGCADYARGMWVFGQEYLWYSIGSTTNNVAIILDWLLYAVDNLLD
jgi:hypothetical protein